MKPSEILARETTPQGEELVLYRHDGAYTLRLDGLELMSSRAHGSEEILAHLACGAISGRTAPRVLVGGLGFGYTLRAALDRLPADAHVVLCEVFGLLLEWNRGVLGELAQRPLEDPRVTAIRADVFDLLDGAELFDAVILDVDNGPWAFTLSSNARLYSASGLVRLARCLDQRGVLTVWSAERSAEFERRLLRAGFDVRVESVSARRGGKGPRHTLFVAQKGS